MTTCPKCHHVRQHDAKVPDWQCPACGVAYAKAADAVAVSRRPSPAFQRHEPLKPERRIPWGRLLAVVAVVVGVHAGLRGGLPSIGAGGFGGASATGDLRTLAAGVRPGEVVIYGTSWCPNCARAKRWMADQGFAFDECDVERNAACTTQWQALGGQGVPYLVVRGHVMKDGFDSDEFVAALKKGVPRPGG